MTCCARDRMRSFISRIELTLAWLDIDSAAAATTCVNLRQRNGLWRIAKRVRPSGYESKVSLSAERVINAVAQRNDGHFSQSVAREAKRQLVEILEERWTAGE